LVRVGKHMKTHNKYSKQISKTYTPNLVGAPSELRAVIFGRMGSEILTNIPRLSKRAIIRHSWDPSTPEYFLLGIGRRVPS
jgi:hypothetical protein